MTRRPLGDPPDPSADLLRIEDLEVTLVGAGRAGSQIALVLAMLGLQLRLYDGDRLGPENQGLQLYRQRDVRAGRKKVLALRRLLQSIVPGCRVHAHPVWFAAKQQQTRSPIVILAVDTMSMRRMLWKRLRSQPGLVLLLDVRLGRGLLRLHEVKPDDAADVAAYETSLYDDEKAAADDCSDEASTHAAAAAAALVGGSMRAFAEGLSRPRWVGVDLDRALWATGQRQERSPGDDPGHGDAARRLGAGQGDASERRNATGDRDTTGHTPERRSRVTPLRPLSQHG